MFCDRPVRLSPDRKQQHSPFSTTPVTGPPRPATLVCRSLLLRGKDVSLLQRMTPPSTASRAAASGPGHNDPNCHWHSSPQFIPSPACLLPSFPRQRCRVATRQLQINSLQRPEGTRSIGQTMTPCRVPGQDRGRGRPAPPLVVTTLNEKVAVR